MSISQLIILSLIISQSLFLFSIWRKWKFIYNMLTMILLILVCIFAIILPIYIFPYKYEYNEIKPVDIFKGKENTLIVFKDTSIVFPNYFISDSSKFFEEKLTNEIFPEENAKKIKIKNPKIKFNYEKRTTTILE